MLSAGQKITDYFERDIWERDLAPISKLKAFRIKTLRLAYVIFTAASDEQLVLRAAGLLYATLLTIVPLLAVSFSVVKALGVDTKLLIFLYYLLEPLGPGGVDISMKVIGFVENVKASILGSVGLAALVYTVTSTIRKMESALNYVWHIKHTRTFWGGLGNYMGVLLISPVLAIAALGSTASLMSTGIMQSLSAVAVLGLAFRFAGRAVPYVLIWIAFAFVYYFLPNTKVRLRAAFAGGTASAILWQTTGWIFASFVASSAQYSAIYSGFSGLILLLIWLHWSFLILLVGAKVSSYSQYPEAAVYGRRASVMNDRLREKAALTVMYLVCDSFHHGRSRPTFNSLAGQTGLPSGLLREVLESLSAKGLVVSLRDEQQGLMPAKDIDTITLKEVFESVRSDGYDSGVAAKERFLIPGVEKTMMRIDEAISGALEGQTMATLVKKIVCSVPPDR